MFAYIKFLCDNICLNSVTIASPDSDVVMVYLDEGYI